MKDETRRKDIAWIMYNDISIVTSMLCWLIKFNKNVKIIGQINKAIKTKIFLFNLLVLLKIKYMGVSSIYSGIDATWITNDA